MEISSINISVFFYKIKYLKYKRKYLSLKGGRLTEIDAKTKACRLVPGLKTHFNPMRESECKKILEVADKIGDDPMAQCLDQENYKEAGFKEKCIRWNELTTSSSKKKFMINLLLEPIGAERCSFDFDYFNWLRNLKIPHENVYNIINKSVKPGCIVFGNVDMTSRYDQTQDFFNTRVSNIIANTTPDKSVVMHISSHGSLIGNSLFSFDGNSHGKYVTADVFRVVTTIDDGYKC